MTDRGDRSPLQYAYELARSHNMRIFPVQEPKDRADPRQGNVTAYVIYRNHIRLGRRRDPGQLLALVKRLAGVDKSDSAASA